MVLITFDMITTEYYTGMLPQLPQPVAKTLVGHGKEGFNLTASESGVKSRKVGRN